MIKATEVKRIKKEGFVEQHQVNVVTKFEHRRAMRLNVTTFLEKDQAVAYADNFGSLLKDYQQLKRRC